MGLIKTLLDAIAITIVVTLFFWVVIKADLGIFSPNAISTGGLFMLFFFVLFAINVVKQETRPNNNEAAGGKAF